MRTRLIASIGVVAVLAAGGLAGCSSSGSGSGSGSGGKNATVTWWSPNWDTPVAKKLITDFEKKNSGITVKLVETTDASMANKISVALDSGTTPDVVTDLASRTQQYVAKDELTNLNGLFGSSMPKSDFFAGSLADVSKGSVAYGIPYRWDNLSLVYNKDMFAAAGISGPPTTIDEFEADAKKLTKGSVTGTAWTMNSNDSMVLRFFGLAASTTAQPAKVVNGVAKLTESSSQQALDVISGSVRDGWATKSSFESDSTAVRQLFANKQIAMYFGGVYDVPVLQAAKINFGTALAPGYDGPSKTGANGWVFIVPKASKNKTAAEKFVRYLATPTAMSELTQTFPARISAAKGAKFHTKLVEPFYTQLLKYSVASPYDPSWGKLEPTLFAQIQAVALGKIPSAQAAKTIQTASKAAQ